MTAQRSAQLEWYYRNKDRIARERQELRLKVVDLYGGKCACCGESEAAFLTIDHVNGNGGEERRLTGRSGNAAYSRLLAQPRREDLQLLCWNCHQAKDMRGGCPHEASA